MVDGFDFDLQPEASPRKVMNVFYLIDVSGSMYGGKIESINQVMPEIMQTIKKINDDNADNAEVRVSCMTFSDDCQWMYDTPTTPDNFVWIPQSTQGCTSMGEACIVLESKLHRNAYLNSSTGHKNPAIILLSDGEPTDDFQGGLAKLKSNNWFKVATKVAIAIGNDANDEVLSQFTGNKELVLRVHNVDALKKMLKVVSGTVSKIGNKSAGADSCIDQVKDEVTAHVNSTSGAEVASSNANVLDEWD